MRNIVDDDVAVHKHLHMQMGVHVWSVHEPVVSVAVCTNSVSFGAQQAPARFARYPTTVRLPDGHCTSRAVHNKLHG